MKRCLSPSCALHPIEQPESWKLKSCPLHCVAYGGEVWEPHSEPYSHSLCVFLHKKRSCFKVSCCNYKNLTSNNPVAFGNPLFSRVLGISTLAKDDIIVGISIGYYQFVL